MENPKLGYTVEEAGERIGLGRTMVFEAIKTGQLEARKCGRRTIILHEALERFLSSLPVREAA